MKKTLLVIYSLLFIGCINSSRKEYFITHEQREKIIKELVELTSIQVAQVMKEGAVNGSGHLYQDMKAYQVLLEICSEKELKEIHKQLVGTIPYIPFTERIEQKRYFPKEWENSLNTKD